MDSNFAFICADFAQLLLKVAKYVNTVQIPAIADVEMPSPANLFLSYQNFQYGTENNGANNDTCHAAGQCS